MATNTTIHSIPNTSNSISCDTESTFILNLVLTFNNFTRILSEKKFLMLSFRKAPFPVLFSSSQKKINIPFFFFKLHPTFSRPKEYYQVLFSFD